MTTTVTPVSATVSTVARDGPAVGPGPRAVAPSGPIDSAQALHPVSRPAVAAGLRLYTARDRPVGPPPAFEINVLEDLRERMSLQAPIDETKPMQRDEAGYTGNNPGENARLGASLVGLEVKTGQTPHLDIKV
jgi:hypothetical protein